jgi:hypothetical protein
MTDQEFQEQLKLIHEVLDDFEREGLVKRTGEYRNGRPVYAQIKHGTA